MILGYFCNPKASKRVLLFGRVAGPDCVEGTTLSYPFAIAVKRAFMVFTAVMGKGMQEVELHEQGALTERDAYVAARTRLHDVLGEHPASSDDPVVPYPTCERGVACLYDEFDKYRIDKTSFDFVASQLSETDISKVPLNKLAPTMSWRCPVALEKTTRLAEVAKDLFSQKDTWRSMYHIMMFVKSTADKPNWQDALEDLTAFIGDAKGGARRFKKKKAKKGKPNKPGFAF